MDTLRYGIIGMGNMGGGHAHHFAQGFVKNGHLAAICDIDSAKLAQNSAKYKVPGFATHQELLASKSCDAIIIAVPHYFHVPIALDAFAANHHVLCEKPLAVSVKAARQVNDAYKNRKNPDLKFGIMFNQRSNPMYQAIRGLVQDGELGDITRVTWLITNWFRTWAYYGSGGWRATWKGEGGGVLINQCPHNLDLIQWVVNGLMPNRVTAVGSVGKTHPIEVEDEISAILEYSNGATGHFVTSTGEAPGTNRLEICGTRGKLVTEDGKITFYRTRVDVQEFSRTSKESFPTMETWNINIPYQPLKIPEHAYIVQNFSQVVLENQPNESLLAPGPEGLHGLELGNAIMMSGLTRQSVELPVDGDAYDRFIDAMAQKYGGQKKLQTAPSNVNLAASFAK